MNYVETARSNYFAVKDRAAFEAWAEDLDLAVIENYDLVGFLSENEQGIPNERWNEDLGDFEEFDFYGELRQHLVPGHVAVVMAVGYEGMRYLTGRAVAVNAKGTIRSLSLDDIYGKARVLGKQVTAVEY